MGEFNIEEESGYMYNFPDLFKDTPLTESNLTVLRGRVWSSDRSLRSMAVAGVIGRFPDRMSAYSTPRQ